MIYFDNAATTFPKPESVLDKMYEYQKKFCANPGRSAHKISIISAKVVLDARLKIAQLFGLKEPMNVIFTKNCTESLNIALLGSIKQNEHIITTVMEHNSIVRVLEHLKKTRNIDVTYLKPDINGQISPESIENAVTEKTSMIALAHSNNLTGAVNDLNKIGEIAKKYKLLFLVDAAQSAGKIPIDVNAMNINYLCFPGHKSLFGPQGTGALCINTDKLPSPLTFGGTGSFSDMTGYIDMTPDRYETGTLNSPGICGLAAGIDFVSSIGIENIRKKEEALTKSLKDKLSSIDNINLYAENLASNCGIVSFNIKGCSSSQTAMKLNDYDVCIRGGLHCNPLGHRFLGTLEKGVCRASLSYFNTEAEVTEFAKIIQKISKEL